MFLNREEKKYPMIQVGLLSELVFNFFYYNINSNHFLASLEDTESLFGRMFYEDLPPLQEYTANLRCLLKELILYICK